ncbi:hypothetical protein K435DRAFT_810741 [Dendrothele bispora CBS 962.96]|uniref:Uncharacterized protein n=1 Tax=Dendrothele bispora (strain CBS 962.96) TaxID=1314807 RepID=A0A4S8KUE5_DENBC|nr:hypothetical protein K435DRAFT_810741 [Dendrothele bispora CBS 962.96]
MTSGVRKTGELLKLLEYYWSRGHDATASLPITITAQAGPSAHGCDVAAYPHTPVKNPYGTDFLMIRFDLAGFDFLNIVLVPVSFLSLLPPPTHSLQLQQESCVYTRPSKSQLAFMTGFDLCAQWYNLRPSNNTFVSLYRILLVVLDNVKNVGLNIMTGGYGRKRRGPNLL